jgi:hypothetical protein
LLWLAGSWLLMGMGEMKISSILGGVTSPECKSGDVCMGLCLTLAITSPQDVAAVPDTPESFGQDMKQQAPEELSAGEPLDHLLACIVFDPKGDEPMAVAKDILF